MDSNEIILFLEKHPLIAPSAVERMANVPTGTIRMDKSRKIPQKHIWPIAFILKKYGMKK